MKRDNEYILYGLSEDQFSTKGIVLLCWLYFGTLLFAALVSPFIFQLAYTSEGFAKLADFFGEGTSDYLREKPITRYFDRIRLLGVLILLPLLFKWCHLYSFSAIGFRIPAARTFFTWFIYGVGMMIAVLSLSIILNVFEAREGWTFTKQLEKIVVAVFSASLLSIIEEVIFRGLVFRLFYTSLKPVPAIIGSSILFAALHFKMSGEAMAHIPPSEIGIDDGFVTALGYITAIADGFNSIMFINLCLVGIILHQVFLLKKNLWACIGLHAGWVAVIMSLGKAFDETGNANLLTGTEKITDGYWVGIVMVVFIIIFSIILSRSKESDNKIS